MARAQGGLEYLIIIAAVMGIAAVVVYTMSSVMSNQSSSASIATCKQAAVDCKASRMLSPNDPCSMCDTSCKDSVSGRQITIGAVECCKEAMVEDIYADSSTCRSLISCPPSTLTWSCGSLHGTFWRNRTVTTYELDSDGICVPVVMETRQNCDCVTCETIGGVDQCTSTVAACSGRLPGDPCGFRGEGEQCYCYPAYGGILLCKT